MFTLFVSSLVLLGTYFRMLDTSQTKDERLSANNIYAKYWSKINESKLNTLPYIIMRKFLQVVTFKTQTIWNFIVNMFSFLSRKTEHLHPNSKILIVAVYTLVLLVSLISFVYYFIRNTDLSDLTSGFAIINYLYFFIYFFLVISVSIIMFNYGYRAAIDKRANVKVRFKKFSSNSPNEINSLLRMTLILSFSFSTSIIAFFLDDKKSYFLETDIIEGRLIFTYNILLDALTIIATIFIFKIAIKRKNHLIHLFLISVDLFLAASLSFIFAIIVLNMQSVEYDYKMIVNYLFGRSKDGNSWYLWEYFWSMHSTFIPTLVFLLILLISIVSKIVILPISRLWTKTSIVENPHKLTGNLCFFFAAFCTVLSSVIQLFM